MKLLYITTRFGAGLGGKENYLAGLTGGLASRGHQVRVRSRSGDAFPEFGTPRRFDAFHRPPITGAPAGVEWNPLQPRGASWLLGRLVYKLQYREATHDLAARLFGWMCGPDLDHDVREADLVHYDGTAMEVLGTLALLRCRRIGRPLVVCPHSHPGSWGDHPLDLRLYREADAVIAKTTWEREFYHGKNVPVERIHVIGNAPHLPDPPDLEDFRAHLGIEGPLVLFAGRRTESKGFRLLLEAMERLWVTRPSTRVLVLSPRDDVADLPEELDPRVLLRPGVSEADKASAFALADVFCLPSRAEAFGIAYVEAWAHGKPVVACRIPALESLISHGEDGLLVDREPSAVARALESLLADPDRARRMGAAGRTKQRRLYSWKAILDATESLYADLITEDGR